MTWQAWVWCGIAMLWMAHSFFFAWVRRNQWREIRAAWRSIAEREKRFQEEVKPELHNAEAVLKEHSLGRDE